LAEPVQVKVTSGQEKLHYEMAFKVDDEDDLAMKKLGRDQHGFRQDDLDVRFCQQG
jgi:hypothetical protein